MSDKLLAFTITLVCMAYAAAVIAGHELSVFVTVSDQALISLLALLYAYRKQ